MVSLIRQNLLHLILIVVIYNNLVQTAPPLGTLLPTIKTLDYSLTPSGNQYLLSIQTYETVPFPGGSFDIDHSQRDEVVKIKNPDTPEQELTVMGTTKQKLSKNSYYLVTEYVADKNGYRAQYKLERILQGTPKLGSLAFKLSVGIAREQKDLTQLANSEYDNPDSDSYMPNDDLSLPSIFRKNLTTI